MTDDATGEGLDAPPHSDEAETSLLGGLMLDENARGRKSRTS